MSQARSIRVVLTVLGVAGFAIFAAGFLASFVRPDLIEQTARFAVRWEVENRVREKLTSLDDSYIAKKAQAIAEGYGHEISDLKRQLEAGLPERIATVSAEMLNLNCECRKKIAEDIRKGSDLSMLSLAQAQERLASLIRTKYMDVAGQLVREFRIFTGTNAIAFALLLLAIGVRRRATVHLLPAAIVLVVATGIASYFYVFNQDWLHTLIFGDYVGFAFIGYLAAVYCLLCDVAFNRGRIITNVLNAVTSVLGSVSVVSPC